MSNQIEEGRRRFPIEAFGRKVVVDPEKTWRILEHAIHEIYNHNASGLDFEPLYRDAHNMVYHKYGERLYSGLVTTTTGHLKEISSSIESAEGDSFLEELNHKWAKHNKALQMIQDILMDMDRKFVPSTHKTPVYELGLNLWTDKVIHSSNIQTRLLNTLLELIQKERTGEVINRGLMRNIIKMLMDLGASVYQEDFEKPFLEESAKLYSLESEEFIRCCDCGDYLKKAERRLNEEIERVSHYLDLRSELKITKVVEREMIANCMHRLVHMERSGLMVVNILLDDKYEDLGRMCNLFCRVEDGLSTIREVMSRHLKEISSSIESAQGDFFLEELNHKWALYNKALQMILPSTHKTPVYELVLNLWRDNVIHTSNTQKRLLNTLLELIQKERTGEVINRGLMRNIIKMLMDLGASVYQEDFEKPFLEVSANFYRVKSQEFIECCDCGNYLKKAEMLFNEEIERVSHYLDLRSVLKITKVMEREIIANHMPRLVHMENSGLVNMLLDDKHEDLGRMYNLFRRVELGLSTIRDVMTSHIRETGKQLVTDPEWVKDPVKFVQRLLDEIVLYEDKYGKIITLAFINDKTFRNALNSSFEYIINLNSRSPEFISLFVDDKLRKGLKDVSEEDVQVVLDKVMILVRYLQQKAEFEDYYKRHLAKRLLSGKTVSDDAERSLIVKLKTECGYQFVSKLEGMFTDMKTSQDTIQGFYASHGAELGDGPTLVVQVLTTGSWPTQPSVPCNLPAELSLLCEKFRSYYLGTHTGRSLSWQTNMGTAVINATFSKCQKNELNVSTFQMCVLMLFNNADKLSYREIEQATEIPAPELRRCLQSLACVKGKNVLRKEPMSKDIGENDVFLFNDKFSSKFYEVKIGTVVALKESEPEMQETQQRVEEDRKPQIEAAIVRIMKSRKVLDHNNIIAEVTKQLQSRFLPNPVEIKKRIESLVEREFLERDSADRNLYRYLA